MSVRVLIGMEVHLQLRTRTKLFCGCENRFGAPPNSLVCPVCLGLPGALPVLNREALRQARLLAAALGADLAERISFDRKHYFYPDLPKGYQITQYERPVATGGEVPLDERSVPLIRLHLEEDAGATTDAGDDAVRIDMNRAGVPLVELVSRPEIGSAEEAVEYVRSIREIARFTGVSDAEMSRGNLRCEPNVNLVIDGQPTPIVEIKNLNSLKSVRRAVRYEIGCQRAEFEATGVTGGHGMKVTRGYDVESGETYPRRAKEEAEDYRYCPDPDLPPLAAELGAIGPLPRLPGEIRARFRDAWGLSAEAARDLTASRQRADYFEAVVGDGGADVARIAAGFVLTDVLREGDGFPVSPERLGGLVRIVVAGRITRTTARTEIWPRMLATGRSADEIVASAGLDEAAGDLDSLVATAIAASPGAVAAYRAGKAAAIGPIVGRVLRAARGRADPVEVRDRIERALDSGGQIR